MHVHLYVAIHYKPTNSHISTSIQGIKSEPTWTVSFSSTQLMACPLSHPSDLEAVDKSFYHSLTTWLDGGDIDGKDIDHESLFGFSHLRCQTFLPALLGYSAGLGIYTHAHRIPNKRDTRSIV